MRPSCVGKNIKVVGILKYKTFGKTTAKFPAKNPRTSGYKVQNNDYEIKEKKESPSEKQKFCDFDKWRHHITNISKAREYIRFMSENHKIYSVASNKIVVSNDDQYTKSLLKMINFGEVTVENFNSNWSQIPDQLYRISITDGSGSEKNLI